MKKTEILQMLDEKGVKYTIKEHPPVETIEAIERFAFENADTIVKNLFLRDEKKRNYYLVVLSKEKHLNLKAMKETLNSRPLGFASEADLMKYLGLEKGSVTPFGIFNDEGRKVRVIIDRDVMARSLIGVHQNENTATVWLLPSDLVNLIMEHGNEVKIMEIIAS